MAKILIVEDEQILREMYEKLLRNHGYEVQTAVDGEEGLNLALTNHPDLILLDIRMPKVDGITVMNRLREDKWGKGVPIILLTNLEANDERVLAVARDQPAYYLVKANNPPEDVLEKVKEIFENNAKENA